MSLYYTAVICLTLISMGIMELIVIKNDMLSLRKKNEFCLIFLLTAVSALLEWIGVLLNGSNTNFRILHIFVKACELSAAPFIAVIALCIIDFKSSAKVLMKIIMLNTILEFISCFGGFIFFVDSQNFYHHGNYYWIYMATYIISSVFAVKEFIKFGKKYQNRNKSILIAILILFIAGVILGMVKNINIDYICLSMILQFIYIYYNEVIQKTDAITGTLNRVCYENKMSNLREKAGILYFDIDRFKHINDNYGHVFGDFCISVAGRKIQSVYGKSGHCYRIGGDEFCVILDKNLDNIDELNLRFKNAMDREREKDRRIPNVSVGYSIFNPEENDVETIIKQADKNMYEMKAENHKSIHN